MRGTILTESVCLSCGRCCTSTEMVLSEQDIMLILKQSKVIQNEDEFSFINKEGLHQLRNVNGHCFFFDLNSKQCEIYYSRPQGCRFYPLIYDTYRKKCILDQDCPHPNNLYEDMAHLKSICKSLREFLKNQLQIHI